MRRGAATVMAVGLVALSACTREAVDGPGAASVTSLTPTTAGGTSTTSTTSVSSTSTTSTSTTSTTTPTTTTTSTTSTTTTTTTLPAPDFDAPALRAVFAAELVPGNLAASITVLLDGNELVRLAAGSTNSGAGVTTDTPMVVASVSKLVTALTISRLVRDGVIATEQPVPWGAMGLAHDPAWDGVTVRELLAHTSGIPIDRKAWLDDPGSCAAPLGALLLGAPTPERGTWVYSNGNYCALGLLIEAVTGERYDAAAYRLVLTPAGITGAHLTVDGSGPDDAPYAKGVARFDRLGGAGQWMMSTDDIARLLAAVTVADREVLAYPGVITDQYGWGHTGSVDGAASCAWILGDGSTIVAATVAGPRPSSGGGVCDVVVPAAAADAGLPYRGEPVRLPD